MMLGSCKVWSSAATWKPATPQGGANIFASLGFFFNRRPRAHRQAHPGSGTLNLNNRTEPPLNLSPPLLTLPIRPLAHTAHTVHTASQALVRRFQQYLIDSHSSP